MNIGLIHKQINEELLNKWRTEEARLRDRIAELEAELKGYQEANKAQNPVHIRVVTELQEARQRITELEAALREAVFRLRQLGYGEGVNPEFHAKLKSLLPPEKP